MFVEIVFCKWNYNASLCKLVTRIQLIISEFMHPSKSLVSRFAGKDITKVISGEENYYSLKEVCSTFLKEMINTSKDLVLPSSSDTVF